MAGVFNEKVDALATKIDAVDAKTDSLATKIDAVAARAEEIADDSRHQLKLAVEHFDKRFDLLTEGILNVDEKLDRRTSDIDSRMEQGFADMQALVKFSHDELHHRVHALEEKHR